MKYLFDTDILIYWLKGNQAIEKKAVAIGLENIGYSIISLAELYFGAYNSEQIDKNLQAIQIVQQKLSLFNFNDKSCTHFGMIKAQLKQQGNSIMDADILIGSIAQANKLILVTNNTKHFQRIPNLQLENWLND
jgi:tRNA(fMet)-specific endonuclease VapC